MRITHFTVFGERCSGTNHAAAWIGLNTGLVCRSDFGWKHGAMDVARLQKSPETLCVLVTRNLPDWLRSLHLKPHHLAPEMRGLPFSWFIKRRVHSIWDHTMGVSPRAAKFGTLMEAEQHNGRPYANLLRMRRHKHRVWLKQMSELPCTLHLQHEELTKRPAEALHKVLAACGLPLRDDPVAVTAYKGKEGGEQFQPRRYAPICPAAMQHIVEQVDWEVEARLGHDTRSDLDAARAGEDTVDFSLLQQALTGQAEALAMLEAVRQKLRLQEDRLQHADLLAQGQRKYLISLFHAIERARPKFPFWPRKRRQAEPGD